MKDLPELAKYRDFNRVLLLFAPERSHPAYREAADRLGDQLDRVEEKEIKILSVFSSGRVYDNHDRLEGANDNAMRRRYGAHRDEFTAVLLDSDGHELLRQERHLNLDAMLYALKPGPVEPPQSPGPH